MNRLLNELDSIKASEKTKKNTLNYVLSKKQKNNYKPFVIAMMVTCVLLFTFISLPSKSTSAFITMDINPSFEIEINDQYKIINIISYNNDGDKIMNQEKLKGKQFQEALSTLLSNQEYEQYLNDGILEISIFSLDKKLSNELEKYIDKQLKQKQIKQYHCSQIDEATHNNASQHHMSAGKFSVIEKILSYSSNYSQVELKTKSMRELYDILEQLNPDDVPNSCQSHGQHKNKRK
ncbi:MAG: hypothetical protein RR585_05185 [Coprobacillus sp.]